MALPRAPQGHGVFQPCVGDRSPVVCLHGVY
jgi:hypothetical protein